MDHIRNFCIIAGRTGLLCAAALLAAALTFGLALYGL